MMIRVLKIPARLGAALLITTTLAAGISATPMPDLSPEQIQSDSERRYDPQTGVQEIVAPSFDPFELDDTIAGSASLRSLGASTHTSIDGHAVRGGAILDVLLFYTTGSNDPYDVRGVEQAVFVSGEPVNTMRYDSAILECSENVREVVYDSGYYSGDRYGYVGGVYRLFPRYRGHRGFGHYDSYPGYYNPGRGWRNDRQRPDARKRKPDNRRADKKKKPKPVHMTGARSSVRPTYGERVRFDSDSSITAQPYISRRPSGTRSQAPRVRSTTRATSDDRKRATIVRNERQRTQAARPTPASTKSAPVVRERRTKAEYFRENPRTKNRQARAERQEQKTRPERSTRQERTQTKTTQSRPTRQRTVDRAVDKSFKSSTRSRSKSKSKSRTEKEMNFYPMQMRPYVRSNVQVSYRCAREEMVSLHIPQERIDAARFDGLTIVLLDRDNREVPVYVPPNYVEGFRRAASGYSAAAPVTRSHYPTPTAPRPRSSHEPIIYGDPTGL